MSLRSPSYIRMNSGFTLLELLAVIVICSLLAVLIFPTFTRIRTEAQRAKCASNMRQYLAAAPLFASDNNGRLPECAHTSQVVVEARIQLGRYLSPPAGLNDTQLFQWTAGISCASTTKTTKGRTWTQGFNSWTSKLPLSSISSPASLIYMMCTTGSRAIRPNTFTGLPDDFREATPRPHSGKINVGFLDGHIETRLASSLTWADFTRGTPSYLTSYDKRMVTTSEYDK